MTSEEEPKILRRYTSLPVLLDMLQSGKLRFGDPDKWEDRNDAKLIELYKERQHFSEVLVLCFTYLRDERFHHWKAYADGIAGCCIEFYRDKLLEPLGDTSGKTGPLRSGEVEPLKLDKTKHEPDPFKKRHAYIDDKEFRIVSQGKTGARKELDIDWSSVKKILLSPKLQNKDIVDSIINSITKLLPRKSDGSSYEIEVSQSTIYESEKFKVMFAGA